MRRISTESTLLLISLYPLNKHSKCDQKKIYCYKHMITFHTNFVTIKLVNFLYIFAQFLGLFVVGGFSTLKLALFSKTAVAYLNMLKLKMS